LQREPEIRAQPPDLFMIAVDEFAAGLERDVAEAVIADGPDAAAQAIAGFEHVHLGAAIDQASRRGQPGEPAANYGDARTFESGP